MKGAGTTSMPPLDVWIGRHGPLTPASALLIARDACVQASRMTNAELDAVIASLSVSGVQRREGAGWQWVPVQSSATRGIVPDLDVIERIGAIMFFALTGHLVGDTFAEEHLLRARLQALRPDLSFSAAEFIVAAATARRRRRPLSLHAFAADVRRHLGVGQVERRPLRNRAQLAAGIIVVALAGSAWISLTPRNARGTHELSLDDTTLLEIVTDVSESFALMDEHTASVMLHQRARQVWSRHVAPQDPRLLWINAHEAWVRALAGDMFTAEQLLGDTPRGLSEELGPHHPYTRAARLALAAVLQRRGAAAEAAALRVNADRDTRTLLADRRRASDVASDLPAPPGVLAHVAPNGAEREGFRQSGDAYAAPLTSVQRLRSGTEGWRLHVVARARCRISFVVGTVPRRITVNADRIGDDTWRVDIAGTEAPLALEHAAAPAVSFAILATGSGDVVARLGDLDRASRIHDRAPVAGPPYTLAFSGAPHSKGCEVVWLEILFPMLADSALPQTAPSPKSSTK
jgi:hypothetical protein